MPLIYTHNDEVATVDVPQIFAVEISTGHTIGTAWLNPALPSDGDPESIRLDVTTGILYLADTGDNGLDRNNYALYGLPEFGPGAHNTLPCKKYPIEFPDDESVNCEALTINPVNGRMYLISKEEPYSRMWRLPKPLSTGGNLAVLVNSAMPPLVTDADFTINGQWLLVRGKKSKDVYVFDDNQFKQVGAIGCPQQAKGESIACEPNGKSFLIGSEGRGGNNLGSPIYRVILPTKYRGISTTAQPTTSPTQPMGNKPGDLFNTRVWKLTLPTGSKGDPDEVEYPALATYEHPKYFYDSNGRVVFNTPYGGVTTDGSVNPRTELREMKTNGDLASWPSASGNHRLTLSKASFNHVGAVEGQATIAQLHDDEDDRMMIIYDSGTVYVEYGNGKGAGGTRVPIINSYAIGNVIGKLALNVNSTGFRVYVDDVEKSHVSRSGTDLYFKAGCYPQKSSSEADSDFAQTRIGGIVVTHT